MLDLIFLVGKLGFQPFLFADLVDLRLAQLLLQALQVSPRVQGAVRVHESLLGVRLNLSRPLSLLLLDKQAHLAALVFKHNKLLVLGFHGLFVVSLLELQLAELFFGDSELVAQLANLLVVIAVLVQLDERLLLLLLHLEERLGLVLELAQDALLVLLLVF